MMSLPFISTIPPFTQCGYVCKLEGKLQIFLVSYTGWKAFVFFSDQQPFSARHNLTFV